MLVSACRWRGQREFWGKRGVTHGHMAGIRTPFSRIPGDGMQAMRDPFYSMDGWMGDARGNGRRVGWVCVAFVDLVGWSGGRAGWAAARLACQRRSEGRVRGVPGQLTTGIKFSDLGRLHDAGKVRRI